MMAVFAAAVFSDRDTDTALDATVDATIDDDNIVLPTSHKLEQKLGIKDKTDIICDENVRLQWTPSSL